MMRILVMSMMTRTMRRAFCVFFHCFEPSVSSPSFGGSTSVDIQDEKEAAKLDDLEEEERREGCCV